MLFRSVAFNRDGSRIVSGSNDKTAKIWNTTTGECVDILRHLNVVSSVAFNHDGSRIISGSHKVVVWKDLPDTEKQNKFFENMKCILCF